MAKQIIIEDINEVSLQVEKVDEVVLDHQNIHYLGVDPSNANAVESDVFFGKTFYAGDNQKKIGSLSAYDVVQTSLGNNTSRLEITTIGFGSSDEVVTFENINNYKTQDLINVNTKVGELATDEEYAIAEVELQKMYSKIMGVGNE